MIGFKLILGHFFGNYILKFFDSDNLKHKIINSVVYASSVCAFLFSVLKEYHPVNFLFIYWVIVSTHLIITYSKMTDAWNKFIRKDFTLSDDIMSLIIIFLILKKIGVV